MEEERQENMRSNGGIINNFQGATIHNMVINGNMNRSGTENYNTGSSEKKKSKVPPTAEQLITAIDACKGLKWSQSGYAVYFCVLKEDYGLADSRTKFEEKMQLMGYADCTAGTLTNAFRRNTFLTSPTETWPQLQGNHRDEAVILAAAFRKALTEAMKGQ